MANAQNLKPKTEECSKAINTCLSNYHCELMPEQVPVDGDDSEEISNFNRFVSRIINNIAKSIPQGEKAAVRSLNIKTENGAPEVAGLDRNGMPVVNSEPLVDVIQEAEFVRVVTELRGASKEDIVITARPEEVNVSFSNSAASYSRTIDMPCLVDAGESHAVFKNGILEISLKRIRTASAQTINIR